MHWCFDYPNFRNLLAGIVPLHLYSHVVAFWAKSWDVWDVSLQYVPTGWQQMAICSVRCTSTLGQLGHHGTQHRNGEEDQTESPFGQHGSDYRGKDLLDALAQGLFTQNSFQLVDGILCSHSMHHDIKVIFLQTCWQCVC